MLPEDVLVHVGAPTGSRRNRERPVCDLRHARRQLLPPRHVVDIDFEDTDVRNRSTPLRRDEGREMAVVVVRRAVHLEGLGEIGDLLGLVEAVPDDVHRGDVHRTRLEEGTEGAVRVEVLAGTDRYRSSAADCRKRDGIEGVHLEPHQAVAFERARDAQHAFGGEIEVQVDDRLRFAARSFVEGVEQADERSLELRRGIALETRPVEAGHQDLRLVARNDDVRLEGAKPALDDLASKRRDVVVGRELCRVLDLPGAGTRRAAVRPVDLDVIAGWPSEELVDGNAERLRFEVEQRVLDAADRLLNHRARALPRRAEEIPDDALDRARVATDDVGREILNDASEPARRAVRVGDLRPADGAVVRRRLEEDPRAPTGVAEERFDLCDLHAAGGYGRWGRSTFGSATSPESTRARARAQSSSSSTLKPSWPRVKKGATTRPSRVPVCDTTRVHAISSALFWT